jgi:hypothetical protein
VSPELAPVLGLKILPIVAVRGRSRQHLSQTNVYARWWMCMRSTNNKYCGARTALAPRPELRYGRGRSGREASEAGETARTRTIGRTASSTRGAILRPRTVPGRLAPHSCLATGERVENAPSTRRRVTHRHPHLEPPGRSVARSPLAPGGRAPTVPVPSRTYFEPRRRENPLFGTCARVVISATIPPSRGQARVLFTPTKRSGPAFSRSHRPRYPTRHPGQGGYFLYNTR